MKNKIDLQRVVGSLGLAGILTESFLRQNHRILLYDPRDIVFKRGDIVQYVYLILYGSIRLQGSEGALEDKVIYAFRRSGSLLGIFCYLEKSHHHTATAVCMENTSLLEIPAEPFLKEVYNHNPLREEVHRQLAQNFKELQYDRDMQRSPTPVRLAHFLIKLLDFQNDLQSRSILMKLTKKDLAKKIGSEPETVVRLLSEWSRKGIIKNKNKMIEICSLSELKEMAQI